MMEIYKQITTSLKIGKSGTVNIAVSLVKACPVDGKKEDFKVWHPEAGYSVWPADQFYKQHRAITRREAQLINQTVAELEVMAISDTVDFNQESLQD